MMMHDDEHDDDHALFQRAMRDVVPLKTSLRVHPAKRRLRLRGSRIERTATHRDTVGVGADLYEVQAGDELLFRRAGVPENVVRRLRRGQYRVEAEIDLHGMVATDASSRLGEFVRAASTDGLRCIRVIHGKGLRSGTRGPVIKNVVNALLRQYPQVLAFASAGAAAGGTGAALVLIKRV